MGVFGEGTLEIPLEEFWEYVEKYHPHKDEEISYGVPIVNIDNQTIEINYAFSSESHPEDWANPPVCLKEWEMLKKKNS